MPNILISSETFPLISIFRIPVEFPSLSNTYSTARSKGLSTQEDPIEILTQAPPIFFVGITNSPSTSMITVFTAWYLNHLFLYY